MTESTSVYNKNRKRNDGHKLLLPSDQWQVHVNKGGANKIAVKTVCISLLCSSDVLGTLKHKLKMLSTKLGTVSRVVRVCSLDGEHYPIVKGDLER